jgi:hypothetical protein
MGQPVDDSQAAPEQEVPNLVPDAGDCYDAGLAGKVLTGAGRKGAQLLRFRG